MNLNKAIKDLKTLMPSNTNKYRPYADQVLDLFRSIIAGPSCMLFLFWSMVLSVPNVEVGKKSLEFENPLSKSSIILSKYNLILSNCSMLMKLGWSEWLIIHRSFLPSMFSTMDLKPWKMKTKPHIPRIETTQ